MLSLKWKKVYFNKSVIFNILAHYIILCITMAVVRCDSSSTLCCMIVHVYLDLPWVIISPILIMWGQCCWICYTQYYWGPETYRYMSILCTIANILEYKVNKINMLNNKERKKLTVPSFRNYWFHIANSGYQLFTYLYEKFYFYFLYLKEKRAYGACVFVVYSLNSLSWIVK